MYEKGSRETVSLEVEDQKGSGTGQFDWTIGDGYSDLSKDEVRWKGRFV